jgi:3-phosphoshikimate 1-carboxyvinyltransferase
VDRVIEGIRSVGGAIRVPGDKSISHRAVILSSIASGKSRLKGLSFARDVSSTLRAMRDIGVRIEDEGSQTVVHGNGIEGFEQSGAKEPVEIDCGNSATTARLLIGLLSGARITARLTGDKSLSSRPMGRVVSPMERFGASIHADNGHLPVELFGGRLGPFRYRVPVPSAQVKSSLMLASLFIDGTSCVEEPAATRDHTERMVGLMDGGITLEEFERGKRITIRGRRPLSPLDITIPGDISSAVFFIVSALITPLSGLEIGNVLLNPTRAHIIDVLKRMGAKIEVEVTQKTGEPVGKIYAQSSSLKGTEVGGGEIPLIIDEIPALAVASLHAEGATCVRDASELRVKESDRIGGIVALVRSFGGDIEELEDGFIIKGKGRLHGAEVESLNDHRIAMAASVMALSVSGNTIVRDMECADVSFPGFYKLLEACATS